jgi:hypothetical protein
MQGIEGKCIQGVSEKTRTKETTRFRTGTSDGFCEHDSELCRI